VSRYLNYHKKLFALKKKKKKEVNGDLKVGEEGEANGNENRYV